MEKLTIDTEQGGYKVIFKKLPSGDIGLFAGDPSGNGTGVKIPADVREEIAKFFQGK